MCRKKAAERRSQPLKYVDTPAEDSDSELHIGHADLPAGSSSTKPLKDELEINNKPLCMELDTGAAVSIMSRSQLRNLDPKISLQPSGVSLQTYTGERYLEKRVSK